MQDEKYNKETDEPQESESSLKENIVDVPVELEHTEQADSDVPKIKNLRQASSVLEALLFATTEPLSLARLEKLLGLTQRTIRGLLLQLQMEYYRNSKGLQIIEVAGGYQMATRPECHPWVAKLRISRTRNRESLSISALETLAIIAYKQPITRQEIDSIRGVDSSGIIKKLQELDLIKVVKKKPAPGRAYLYGTTKEFLRMFGLKSVKDLPSLGELRDLLGLPRK
ncbi:SMC-Scp complex subunit ScpB [Candidatus Sumerlaeota bacterium]|nr:SMC-Scp complex subunit ScpB [Candidatus Sumerlaeota bacterium]